MDLHSKLTRNVHGYTLLQRCFEETSGQLFRFVIQHIDYDIDALQGTVELVPQILDFGAGWNLVHNSAERPESIGVLGLSVTRECNNPREKWSVLSKKNRCDGKSYLTC